MYRLCILVVALYSFLPCLASEPTNRTQGLINPSQELIKNYKDFQYKPLIAGLTYALSTMAIKIPRGLIPLDEYQQRREYDEIKINPRLIKNFLDRELTLRCIDPTTVTYLIGAEGQDWQFMKLSQGYGLVIPEATASIGNLAQRLLGTTKEIEPEHPLNIKKLSDLLSEPTTQKTNVELKRYKLAIVKAIIKASSESSTNLLIHSCTGAALTHAVEFSAKLSQELSNALLALSYLYEYSPLQDQWIKFQQELDNFILKSADIDLIQAHIEDLEEQLATTKNSYTAKLLSYLPIPQDQLEKRIEIMKEYADSFELKMLGRFSKK